MSLNEPFFGKANQMQFFIPSLGVGSCAVTLEKDDNL